MVATPNIEKKLDYHTISFKKDIKPYHNYKQCELDVLKILSKLHSGAEKHYFVNKNVRSFIFKHL